MFNLIRYKNLLFIILIQWLIFNALLNPLLQLYNLSIFTPVWLQWCSIFATVCIAAGGYIINDYFDLKIDRINRPDKVIIGEKISKKGAMRFYIGVTTVGVLIGVITSLLLGNMTLGFIYIMVPGILWFYSASYKRQLLIGNLLVAVCSGLMIIVPLLVESTLLTDYFGEKIYSTAILSSLYAWVCGYAGFAFLWTMIREIIKDGEDMEGDREYECHTMPIVWGEVTSKIVVSTLVVIAVGLLLWCVNRWIVVPDPSAITVRYALFGNAIPAACLLVLLWSNSCVAYKNASNMSKFIMLIGLLYIPVHYYLLAKAYGLTMFGLFKVV